MRRLCLTGVVAGGLLVGWATAALADPDDASVSSSLPKSGPLSALNDALAQRGVKLDAVYIGEGFGNSGGMRQGPLYEGRLDLSAEADLEKLMGWHGATFRANFFYIHGDQLSREHIGNLMLFSGIEALNATRLYEVYIDQKFLDDRFSLRVGQFAADSEFLNSRYAEMFVNSSFGWPVITGTNLPAGGPAPPIANPGIRGRWKVDDHLAVKLAVFDGDAAGLCPEGNAQICNRHGLNFRVNDPPMWIGEFDFAYTFVLPGQFKLGTIYHGGYFSDQRFTASGGSQADPLSDRTAAVRRKNTAFYGVVEQQLLKLDQDRNLGAFLRVVQFLPDRNLIDFYVDGGFTFAGLLPFRPADKFGIAAGYANFSSAARALDRDFATLTAVARPVRDYEAAIEVSYQAEVVRGWTIQPDFQYIWHPSGGAANPLIPSGTVPLKDAFVYGVRTTVKY